MMRPFLPVLLAAAACMLVVPQQAAAQLQNGTTEMAVDGMIDVAMSGSGVRDLDFGILTPGVPLTVSVDGVTSAKWRFTGLPSNKAAANRYADLNFISLPAVLSGPGGATLPIGSYIVRVSLEKDGADYYTYGTFTVSPASPAISPNPQINQSPGGTDPPDAPGGNNGRALVVYMGATVSPTLTQRAGVYIGVLTLTFSTSSAT